MWVIKLQSYDDGNLKANYFLSVGEGKMRFRPWMLSMFLEGHFKIFIYSVLGTTELYLKSSFLLILYIYIYIYIYIYVKH